VEIALDTAVFSAYFIYKKIRKGNILITKFRDEIAKGPLNHKNVEENTIERRRSYQYFRKTEGSSEIGRVL
jgi:hypothetical protein